MTASTDDRRLEDAITLIARETRARGVTLARTKLVKLLYFLDLAAWNAFGRLVTGVEWVWDHHGPYSQAIVSAYERMGRSGELELQTTNNYFGSPEYRIKSKDPLFWVSESNEIDKLVVEVVADFGSLTPTAICEKSYKTKPMRELKERGGRRGDPIEFPSTAPSPEAVRSAVDRYRELIPADQSEYGDLAAVLRDDAAALDEARRSAGSKIID